MEEQMKFNFLWFLEEDNSDTLNHTTELPLPVKL